MESINANNVDRPRPGSRAAGFRRAVLRGLGVVLPPLLTIVVLIWAWTTIESYVLTPIESNLRQAIVWNVEKTLTAIPAGAQPTITTRKSDGFTYEGIRFLPDPTGRRFIPEDVKQTVDENLGYFGPFTAAPASANAYWHRYVQLTYLQRRFVVPVFLVLFTTVLYFLGRILTVGLGRWLIHRIEGAILRIPLINKVYGGVKQVTDLAFSEREIEFNRVVAIQYPREGIWSLGFVTGNSFRELVDATGEPMLSVLMPTSPMPMTGFIVNVKRREAIDMNITIDEAIQFIVSCGVVVPAHQKGDRAIEGAARTGTPVITTTPAIQVPNSSASK
jgi:uncharacterized membrane protein